MVTPVRYDLGSEFWKEVLKEFHGSGALLQFCSMLSGSTQAGLEPSFRDGADPVADAMHTGQTGPIPLLALPYDATDWGKGTYRVWILDGNPDPLGLTLVPMPDPYDRHYPEIASIVGPRVRQYLGASTWEPAPS